MNAALPAPTKPWPDDLIRLDALLPLGEAAKLVRRWTGRRTNPTTLWRWTRTGRHGVLLPHARVGRAVFTTEAAVRWFIEQTTAAEIAGGLSRPVRRAKTGEDIDELLEQEGL